ncbi:MAG: hypothetical protein NWE99_00915 [Candidatus Bathyarchaeota archaeon]|nr:hypothetical protein [Candidatus Bathyarchaeota archaeon]
METDDNVKFALAVLDLVSKKKEEIKTLTSEIIELESEHKNIVKIKQNVLSILNAVATCSNSRSCDLQLVKLSAEDIFHTIRMFRGDNDNLWGILLAHSLEDFCTYANAWNPIKFDFHKKGWKIEFKNLNIGAFICNE